MAAAENFVFFSPEMIQAHLRNYNEAEKASIEKDLTVVRSVCFSDAQSVEGRAPVYIATAGGPGARKSTILERFIDNHLELEHAAYLDPDPRTLRFMVHTYYSQSLNNRVIAEAKNYDQVIIDAYYKWRGGSNYIALTLLEEAFRNRYDIAYGTTSTGSHMGQFLPQLKQAGYRIELLLCSCEDDLRNDAIEYRNKEVRFYQSSPEDALSKGKFFSQRMPLYFQFADKLYFYWSTDLAHEEILAAVLDGSHFEVFDLEGYIKFVGKYEEDRELHRSEGLDLPSFQELLTSRTGDSE
ncbi:MAG: hypothetical protein HW387_547 [Parachlamydiales bacterium]|nr:hypothetical protein [Parachlamydiales bacterium]